MNPLSASIIDVLTAAAAVIGITVLVVLAVGAFDPESSS